LQPGAQLDLAAPQALAQQLAQHRLVGAQLVGQPKTQVQKAAVDGAQLQTQAAACVFGGWGAVGIEGQGLLTTGVAGHTVN